MISEALIKSQTARITFVMVDASYTEVAGLLGTTTIAISKNGGPLVPSTGTKGEIGSGWYYYDLTAVETDTVGPLSVKLTHAGCIQQNLEYVVEQRNGGACPYTYTVLHSVTGLPISGVEVWFHTNIALTNVVWYGVTDAFGVARDSYGTLPSLDPGTYYLKRHKPAYSFPAVDTEVVSCSAIIVADDSGSLSLDGAYSNCTLGGSINRAWFNGVNSFVDFYTPGFVANFNGQEVTIVARAKVNSPTVWTDGLYHNIIVVYGVGCDMTIDINNIGLLEGTYWPSVGFPLARTVVANDLGWMTTGFTASIIADEYRFYKEGLQQGLTIPFMPGTTWTGALIANGCMIGLTTTDWKGWIGDCIISFGVVATPAQMLSIHTKLDLGTLTTTDLNTIFGVGKYVWYRLNESP